MNQYQKDPQLALDTLTNISSHIPRCISEEDVARFLPMLSDTAELTKEIKASIGDGLREKLQTFWAQHKVNEKLLAIKDLKKCERTPVTGKEIMDSVEAQRLEVVKDRLRAKIQKLKAENDEREAALKCKAPKILQQIEDMKSCDMEL